MDQLAVLVCFGICAVAIFAQNPNPTSGINFDNFDRNKNQNVDLLEWLEMGITNFKYADKNGDLQIQGGVEWPQDSPNFRRSDLNRNGIVDNKEIGQGLVSMFLASDSNGNGVLDRNEINVPAPPNGGWANICKITPQYQPVQAPPPFGTSGINFNNIDANNDQKVDITEWLAMGISNFKYADKNGDLQVARAEWVLKPSIFDRSDLDRNGFVDPKETGMDLLAMFLARDTNGNAFLERAEIEPPALASGWASICNPANNNQIQLPNTDGTNSDGINSDSTNPDGTNLVSAPSDSNSTSWDTDGASESNSANSDGTNSDGTNSDSTNWDPLKDTRLVSLAELWPNIDDMIRFFDGEVSTLPEIGASDSNSTNSDDGTDSDSTNSDSTDSDSTDLDSTDSDSTDLDSTDLDSTDSDSTDLDSTSWDTDEEDATIQPNWYVGVPCLPCPCSILGWKTIYGKNSTYCLPTTSRIQRVKTQDLFKTAEEALSYCRSSGYGAKLASFSSKDDWTELKARLVKGNRYWIGLNDKETEGTYVNEYGGPHSFEALDWAKNEPSAKDGEDCVFISKSLASIRDAYCSKKSYRFICEYKHKDGDQNEEGEEEYDEEEDDYEDDEEEEEFFKFISDVE